MKILNFLRRESWSRTQEHRDLYIRPFPLISKFVEFELGWWNGAHGRRSDELESTDFCIGHCVLNCPKFHKWRTISRELSRWLVGCSWFALSSKKNWPSQKVLTARTIQGSVGHCPLFCLNSKKNSKKKQTKTWPTCPWEHKKVNFCSCSRTFCGG